MSDEIMKKVGWTPDTPQVKGRKTERKILSDRGARAHPNSGAGKIKYDGSDEDTIYEVKERAKSFTMNGLEMRQSHVAAIRQGKEVVWVVYFSDQDITVEMTVKPGRQTPI